MTRMPIQWLASVEEFCVLSLSLCFCFTTKVWKYIGLSEGTGECPAGWRLPEWGTRPHLPAHSATFAQYSTLTSEFICKKVYLKELVSVLLAGDCLYGAPGPTLPLTVLPLRSIAHYLMIFSLWRSILRELVTVLPAQDAWIGHQAPPPRSLRSGLCTL